MSVVLKIKIAESEETLRKSHSDHIPVRCTELLDRTGMVYGNCANNSRSVHATIRSSLT